MVATHVAYKAPVYPFRGFWPPPTEPTLDIGQGVQVDFNFGVRIRLPPRRDGRDWTLRLTDLDTGDYFETKVSHGAVSGGKVYFIRYGLELFVDGELVLDHIYSAENRNVLIQMQVGALGDTIAWFPYVLKFQKLHNCRIICCMKQEFISLFSSIYPQITFISSNSESKCQFEEDLYASYYLGFYFRDAQNTFHPTDTRLTGIAKLAAYTLGVDPSSAKLTVAIDPGGRPIEQQYVCIAVQASGAVKLWHHPDGWFDVVNHLKSRGLRVICIDGARVQTCGVFSTHIPHGCEDETGLRPLSERARWLKHAEAYVGLSSGLSWLAHAVECPVVMISGFSHPSSEFETPYRVINWHVCNSCWNDPRHAFDHDDFFWCPRHKGAPRQYECSKLIRPQLVIQAIDRALADAAQRRINGHV